MMARKKNSIPAQGIATKLKASKLKVLPVKGLPLRSKEWEQNTLKLSNYRLRLEEAYQEIKDAPMEDLETILSRPDLNAAYQQHCNQWRRVQAVLDWLPPVAKQEDQRFALACLKALVGDIANFIQERL
jgi:hypothetical protein